MLSLLLLLFSVLGSSSGVITIAGKRDDGCWCCDCCDCCCNSRNNRFGIVCRFTLFLEGSAVGANDKVDDDPVSTSALARNFRWRDKERRGWRTWVDVDGSCLGDWSWNGSDCCWSCCICCCCCLWVSLRKRSSCFNRVFSSPSLSASIQALRAL